MFNIQNSPHQGQSDKGLYFLQFPQDFFHSFINCKPHCFTFSTAQVGIFGIPPEKEIRCVFDDI